LKYLMDLKFMETFDFPNRKRRSKVRHIQHLKSSSALEDGAREYFPLLQLDAEVSSHLAYILSQEGNFENAEKLISQFDCLNFLGPEKPQILLAWARIRLDKLMKQILENPTLSVLLDSVLVIPAIKQSKLRRPSKAKLSSEYIKLLNAVEQDLLDAVSYAQDCSYPQLLYEMFATRLHLDERLNWRR